MTPTTISDTWKLGKLLSSPLIGRTHSISRTLQRFESRVAPDSGTDHRSATGKKRKNRRLIP